MILQALYDYSRRQSNDTESRFAPEGFVEKRIDFFVVIGEDGSYVAIESKQVWFEKGKSKKLAGTKYFVPAIDKQAVKHTMAGDDANLLWDNAGFLFGLGKNGEKKRSAFINTITAAYRKPPCDVAAILKFYERELLRNEPFSEILSHPDYGEAIRTGNALLTFKIDGEASPVIEAEHVKKALFEYRSSKDVVGCCLITGESDCVLEPTHWALKGVVGAQASGANLVSFNSPAYCSYGKEQSINAPVSRRVAMEYSKALQYLIDSETNKIRLGDTTIVFWAEEKDPFEEVFSRLIGLPRNDPDAEIQAFNALYDSEQNAADSVKLFSVLGLAPNSGRISIRFWYQATIAEVRQHIRQHFDDIDIVRPVYDKGYYSLYWVLFAMAREIDHIPQSLSGHICRSVITGSIYPNTMLQQFIRRVRSTQEVTRVQAGILKAYLNRLNNHKKSKEKEIAVGLDLENTNPGYRLGRLYAVLEKIQERAN